MTAGNQPPHGDAAAAPSRWRRWTPRVLALLLALAISITIFALRDRIAQIGAYGYPGVFLISVLASATIVLPAPSLAVVFALGSSLNPVLVGLAAGLGEALGELAVVTLVALPLGLMSAIYLNQYASARTRSVEMRMVVELLPPRTRDMYSLVAKTFKPAHRNMATINCSAVCTPCPAGPHRTTDASTLSGTFDSPSVCPSRRSCYTPHAAFCNWRPSRPAVRGSPRVRGKAGTPGSALASEPSLLQERVRFRAKQYGMYQRLFG